VQTVGFFQRCNQSSSFCAGEGSCVFSVAGRPFANLSKIFLVIVVIPRFLCRDRRKYSLRHIVDVDGARFVEVLNIAV
jgi:hypothetical protein